jgi:outer membrane receptor protein involved in Fe transport
MGVKNVFNQEYIDHLSRFKSLEIPNIGINFYVGLTYNFGYKLK